jgi:hypothetical protein
MQDARAAHGTIRVPIKPHLKKFFLMTYDLQEPVKLEEDSILGNHVMAILQDKRSVNGKEMNYITSQFNGDGSDLLTETLLLQLSAEMQKRSPQIRKLVRINLFLQYMFRHSVIVFIKGCIKSGVNPYNACKQFLQTYEFDENEYSLDGIHQIWKRYQANPLKKNQTGVLKKSKQRTKALK